MKALPKDCGRALREAYAREDSYAKVGRLLVTPAKPQGYSAAAVCQLLGGTYKAKDVSPIAAAIRSTLLKATVTCPALGEIPLGACLDWQAKPFAATNQQRREMYRACRSGCPNSRIGR